MAADKITIDLDLNARKAQREVAALQKKIDALGKSMSKGLGGVGGRGGVDKVRALGTGLSKATVRADEFNKSLEASNARVIAFGASAGLIMQVERALRAMVVSAVKVEKAMADVNVVMNASTKTLEQFGRGMFKVAKDTAQGFDTVAEAATELARQGLGMEKTLARTKDALILTRLTGMNAADAVKSLTAAVNSFNKEGTTSAQVINRMAKVDAAFAVSSEDLAKSISRVGSSAVDAGVSLNQLMAITTSVQQKTARGGAVIGNAFKTIFTRIQRSDVRKTLADIGVATTDMNGKMLDGVTILENLSRSFGRLTKTQQASVAENVAGVFQVNILRAAMSDLVNKNSEYAKALRVANTATNEAYQRNEELNKTLDALANRTLANLTSAGAAIGGGVFEPAIRKVLEGLNSTIESFGKGGAMEGVGDTIGKGLMAGIGNFISGPGLILVTAAFGKLALNLGKFATTALKDFMGLNTAVKQRAALEEMVLDKLRQEPALVQAVVTKEKSILQIQREILQTMELQTAERAQMQAIATPVARGMYSAGARVTPSGFGAFGRGTPGRAGGFIPNFASAGAERAAAAAGGYQAGAIRTMSQPGAGTMMYNSAETVKQFPGMTQKAIMPPQNSAAGAGYKAAFGAAHGFNPYAASGFVPNFARTLGPGLRGPSGTVVNPNKIKGSTLEQIKKTGGQLNVPGGGIAMLVPQGQPTGLMSGRGDGPYGKFTATFPVLSYSEGFLSQKYPRQPARVDDLMKGAAADVTREFASSIKPPARMPGKREVARALENTAGAKGALSAAAGAAFEVGMDLALDKKAAAQDARYGDFDVRSPYAKRARGIFGGNFSIADFKIASGTSSRNSMAGKIAKELLTNGPGRRFITHTVPTGKAMGFVPNFSPLSSAISREMAAGVPASAIRVGSSPALRSAGNPGGVGVYNTIDEPAGLGQGVSRARRMGLNPKTHGAAEGFVPNFMLTNPNQRPEQEAAKDQKKAAKENVKASGKIAAGADKMMMAGMMINMALSGAGSAMGVSQKTQSGLNAVSNIGGMALMGAGFGLPGMIAGGALGALTSVGDISTMLGLNDAEIAAEEMKKTSAVLKEAFSGIAGAFKVIEDFDASTPLQRIKALKDITDAIASIEATKATNPAAQSVIDTARKRLNLDEILASGGKSGLPEGGLSGLEEELANVMSEVIAANQRGSLEDMVTGALGGKTLFSKSIAEGTHSVGKQYKSFGSNLEFNLQKFKASYTPEMQAALVGVEGNVDSLKSIKELVAPMGAGDYNEKTGMGGSKDFTKTISAAVKMSAVLRRSGFDNLASEMMDAAGAAEKEMDSGRVGRSQIGLQRLLFSLFNDEGLAGLSSPESVAAGTVTPDGEKPSLMSQMEFNRNRRQGRISRAGRAAGMRAATAARIGNIRRGKASRDVLRANRGRMAGITMAGDALIDEQGDIATKAAEDKARTARTEIVVNQQAKLEQKTLKALDSMIDAVAQTAGNLDDKNELIEKFNTEYRNISEKDAKARIEEIEESAKGEKPTSKAQDAELKFLEQRLIDLKQNHAEQKGLLDEADKARDAEIENINAGTEARKKERKAMLEFQKDVRIQQIRDNATKTKNEAAGLRALRKEGFGITGREIADADRAARRAAIRAGKSSGDPMAAFRESFAYGDTDAILEFEDGVVSVAENMKSSFANAFRAIASGSATAGEAIGAMAQSILDSISQVSTNMFSSMLFQQMGMGGKAQGGYVPGYNSGGLIVGGSGYKDDVPIRATGGEFVIKKSAVNKIGVPTLNAINGMANGGPSLGKVGLIAAGASAASGLLGAAMQPGSPSPAPSQNYGFGRSKHGYLGGADPDARGADMIGGGAGRASVSLNKAYVYYRRDPQTGQLISERARPTEGRFEVSDRLSLLGRLGDDDPQTARMFQKEEAMSKYQGYLSQEASRRRAAIKAVERKKRGNLIQAYANAAMLIGGAYMMNKANAAGVTDFTNTADPMTSTGMPQSALDSHGGTMNYTGFTPDKLGSHGMPIGTRANGGMIATMGGEYIMSPEAVRTHGINFMTELNRGNVPGYASGGLVGSAPAAGGGMIGGSTTNNVSISVNIDKNGKATADGSATSERGGPSEKDKQTEIDNNKELGQILKGVVLQEIVRQQRPGGLLNNNTTGLS